MTPGDVSKVTDMSYMFDGAASFDQPLGTWNVSSVTDMQFMVRQRRLVPAEPSGSGMSCWMILSYPGATETLDIRAQSSFLDGHNPVYDLGTGGDSGLFIVNTATKTLGLDPNGVHYDGTYHVIVTSTGGFGTANHRTVAVTVEGIRSVPVPPTFVSSVLDIDAGVLTITFSETIDAANIVPAGIHIRELGELRGRHNPECRRAWHRCRRRHDLVCPHSIAPCGSRRTGPRRNWTIEPGAVRDTSGNLIVDTFDASTRTFVDATDISAQEDAPNRHRVLK